MRLVFYATCCRFNLRVEQVFVWSIIVSIEWLFRVWVGVHMTLMFVNFTHDTIVLNPYSIVSTVYFQFFQSGMLPNVRIPHNGSPALPACRISLFYFYFVTILEKMRYHDIPHLQDKETHIKQNIRKTLSAVIILKIFTFIKNKVTLSKLSYVSQEQTLLSN